MADSIAQLADPMDYGNKPGEGPLRVGGQATKASDSDKDKPSTRSPQSAAQQPALGLVRDLYDGADRVRARTTVYLPRAPGEDYASYQNRLNRSAFFNAFTRTVDGLTGLVFRKDPKLGEDVPEVIRGTDTVEGHWENIDMAGTHGDVFVRDIFEDTLVDGHAAVLVDFPQTDGRQDAAAEMTGAIRPYWVPIKKADIMSWRTENVNGQLVLTQLVLRESRYVPDGDFGEVERTQYRVLYKADGVVGWRLLSITEQNVVVEEARGTYPTQRDIPVAEIISSGRRSIFVSDPPLKDLAYLNVAHYQIWSDQMWSAHKTCVPFIFGAGITEATDPQTGQKRKLVVGANTAVLTPEPSADMKYVAHDGASLGAVKQILDDLKSDMGAIGLQQLAPQTRAAETAEAKRLDKATSDSALAVTARGVQDGIERALGYHAAYLRQPSGGSLVINRDFEALLMEAPVMQAFAQLVGVGFPPRAVLKGLQSGGRIAEDEDLDMLELEWLAGAAANVDAPAEPAEPPQDDELDIERDADGRVTRLVKRRA